MSISVYRLLLYMQNTNLYLHYLKNLSIKMQYGLRMHYIRKLLSPNTFKLDQYQNLDSIRSYHLYHLNIDSQLILSLDFVNVFDKSHMNQKVRENNGNIFHFFFESITLKTKRTKKEIHYSDTQSKLHCVISSNKRRKKK